MAQHNTDYGLVYDDEGKICVTKRTDIIPFPGVTSYAVETATTNFMPSEKTFVEGTYGNSYPFFSQGFDFATLGINNLEKVTFSLEFYNDSIAIANGGSLLVVVYRTPGTSTFVWHTTSSPTWVRREYTFQRDDSITDDSGNPYTGFSIYLYHYPANTPGYTHIRKLQVEKKPFASSFVNGTRPNGRLVVEPENLGFNPGTDDWVVHYWKYPVATKNDSLTDYNLNSFGRWTSGYVEGYIYWGKPNGSNVFRLTVIYNDNTSEGVDSTTFDPAWYFRHWHHEVLLKHGSEMQYWVDGILLIQMALTKTLLNNFTLGLTINGYGGGNPCNSYIANLCYGKYTDQWTPEYIQRISAMTSTFYVPTKRVIV